VVLIPICYGTYRFHNIWGFLVHLNSCRVLKEDPVLWSWFSYIIFLADINLHVLLTRNNHTDFKVEVWDNKFQRLYVWCLQSAEGPLCLFLNIIFE